MPSAGALATARGHLDEGVGPALGRRAGQLVDPRRAPQAFLGLGAVGLEEVVLEAVELVRDNGARDRVEGHLAEPHPAEARFQEDVAGRLAVLFGGVGPVGVGQLLPVTQGPVEVLEAHLGRLGDEHRLVARHGGLGALTPGRGDGLGRIGADGTVAPGLGHLGQMAQGPGQADPALGGGPGDPTTRGDPRRRRLGAVGRPLLAHLEGRRRLGDEGLEAREQRVQLLDRRAVAVVRRARRDQCTERLAEVVQLHGSMEPHGCHTFPARNSAHTTPRHGDRSLGRAAARAALDRAASALGRAAARALGRARGAGAAGTVPAVLRAAGHQGYRLCRPSGTFRHSRCD